MKPHILRCERGNSLIEMGFVAPLLTTLIIGTIDLSLAYSEELAIEQVAQRTIERVQADTYKTSQNSLLQSEAESAAGVGSTASVSSWLECNNDGVKRDFNTGSCSAGVPYARYVEIEVVKTFDPMFGKFFPGANQDGTIALDATAGVRVQ